MRRLTLLALLALVAGGLIISASALPQKSDSLHSQREVMIEQIKQVHRLTDGQTERVRDIIFASSMMGQGNPTVTQHPATPTQCRDKLKAENVSYENSQFENICGGKYMAPLYDRETQTPEQADACIDQFEFPDIPCAYPVIWVKAEEAAELCEAVGKRICDAHEWEGACAGSLEAPDYPFDRGSVQAMRTVHNAKYAPSKAWAYGPKYERGVCGADSEKSPGCSGGNWNKCGSNTYPTGYFPGCKSALGIYDQHGNAAEHMNLPRSEDQMASRQSTTLGVTEMKGSWFIFDKFHAHPDWCRWRAPYWHGSRVMVDGSHRNYHLGFRCCKSIKKTIVKQ
jgi:formylglycine-generating enzyme required for sulfatase activity